MRSLVEVMAMRAMQSHFRAQLKFLAPLLTLLFSASSGAINKCVEAQGGLLYTDQPCVDLGATPQGSVDVEISVISFPPLPKPAKEPRGETQGDQPQASGEPQLKVEQ